MRNLLLQTRLPGGQLPRRLANLTRLALPMETTFLVITDLSPAVHRAAYFAALLARAVGGCLVLVPVEQPLPPTAEMGLLGVPLEYYHQEHRTTASALAELAALLPAPTHLERGVVSLEAALDDLTGRWHPQLLVLSLATEHDVLDHLLLNQALPVLREAGLPLLLVPETAAQNPHLPRVIAVAADGDAFQLTSPARALQRLLASWPADFYLVHVARPDEPAANFRQIEEAVFDSGLLPAQGRCRTYQVQHQPFGAGIVQAALDVQADLLVLPVRPRTLVANVVGCGVAAQVSRTCPVPMLLLPTVEVAEARPEADMQQVVWAPV